MSWLTNLVGDVWGGLVSLGKAIVNATAPVVATVMDTLRRGVDAVHDALKKEFRPPPANERERIERELQDVNDRIMRLRKRYYGRGHLTESEKRENAHLIQERAALAKELEAVDQAETAEDIVNDEDKYQAVDIDSSLTHILQYHVGQFTFNKTCRLCGRAMILQTRQNRPVADKRDFFWSCVGFWDPNRQCRFMQPLSGEDFKLFVNVKRPEFALVPEELSRLVVQNPNEIQTAMGDLIAKARRTGEGIRGYRCPIHKERLVPREKKESSGLLDQFFLGCPHWSSDRQGCNYVVKVKSPAQFSAVLEASGEGGLLHVTH